MVFDRLMIAAFVVKQQKQQLTAGLAGNSQIIFEVSAVEPELDVTHEMTFDSC